MNQKPFNNHLINKEMYGMSKVKIGIIGAGQIAKVHLEMYRISRRGGYRSVP